MVRAYQAAQVTEHAVYDFSQPVIILGKPVSVRSEVVDTYELPDFRRLNFYACIQVSPIDP